MTDIVFQGSEGQPLTNSVLVAEKFGKRHDDLMKKIKNLVDMKVCRNARCTFFLVYHRYKSVYFLQAAIIRRFL